MMRGSRFLLIVLALAVMLVLAACGNLAATPTPFPTLEAEVISAETETEEVDVDSAEEDAPPTATPEPEDTRPPATPTARATSTHTPIPTPSAIPSATPTSAPQFRPTLAISEPQPVREGVSTPATAIPTAVATFAVPSDTTNILLLGSDAPVGDTAAFTRTDTMIIVSINREGPTASMVSLPRDLYVYIPGGTMNRLNTAITLGGPNLLKQTILYNFGIPIHYYAQVDFGGFEDIVDTMGGIEVAVNCEFRDWRLISPELDPEDEENWEVQTLPPAVYDMDGSTALWYARSRLLSNDFDRGRRQQQILRAMLDDSVDLGLVAQVPELYGAFDESVETDMDIGRILQIASLAPAIRDNGIQNLYLLGKTIPWTVPESAAQVQLPNWEGPGMMGETLGRLFQPPALNRATRAPIFVEVVNASGNEDMAQLAAENLAWYGFVPIISEDSAETRAESQLMYYAPNFKGSFDWLISWLVGIPQDDILLNEVDESDVDYRLIIGEDFDPCVDPFFAPY